MWSARIQASRNRTLIVINAGSVGNGGTEFKTMTVYIGIDRPDGVGTVKVIARTREGRRAIGGIVSINVSAL